MESKTSHYITSIDGLRALAITLVLLFHVDLHWIEGGFIGVDIFFVISGFLITSNILRDLEKNQWSFSTFYIKRVARLFPALFTTILMTILVAYFILTPDDLVRLSKSALFTTFSLSNFFFFSEAGYFDSSAATKPLLHTWSLSVEEQFYIIWPITLFLILKYSSRKTLQKSLIAISIVSVTAAFIVNQSNPDMVFFITPFRAYQFGIGGLIAISNLTLTKNKLKYIGIFSIIILFTLPFTESSGKHILLIAALPALAAGGFIIAAETPFIKLIFASQPLVWLGQRSYSIYLVHWPLIVFWKFSNNPRLETTDQLLIIALSIFGGFLLHLLIEKPFRLNRKTFLTSKFKPLSTASTLLILIISTSTLYSSNKGFPDRVPNQLIEAASNLGPRWETRIRHLRTNKCNILIGTLGDQQVDDYDTETCLIPSTEDKLAYLIIGDSYASGAYLLFKEAYPEIYFGQLTIPGCRLIPTEKIKNKVCSELFENTLNSQTIKDSYNGIIIASNWSAQDMKNIKSIIDRITALNKETILLGQRIRFDSALPSIILSTMNIESANSKANKHILPYQQKINSTMKKRFAGSTKYVDMIELQCPQKCDVLTDGNKIVYLDDAHFSMEGISLISKRLKETHPNLFNSRL